MMILIHVYVNVQKSFFVADAISCHMHVRFILYCVFLDRSYLQSMFQSSWCKCLSIKLTSKICWMVVDSSSMDKNFNQFQRVKAVTRTPGTGLLIPLETQFPFLGYLHWLIRMLNLDSALSVSHINHFSLSVKKWQNF